MLKRILVVDDDPAILEMTALVLGKKGYEVLTAANGLLALTEIRKLKPDLILTDVLMPEMDGFAFYKELKKDPITADIPVLIITARGKMEDTFKVMGVDGFIAKPILPEDLFVEIEHVFRIQETRQEIASTKREDINKKILMVSPDEALLSQMKFQAERAGYIVASATSGAEAVTRVVKFLPEIIFIDVLLEDISVGEAIHIVRRLPQFENKPIIGFCHYKTDDLASDETRKRILGIEEMSKQAIGCGAAAYMGRYTAQVFIKTLQEHLKVKRF
jgi:CheY-like chemotaxis protein